MLPRIDAMEQLSAIEAHAMATGSAEDEARRERFDKLRARALGEAPAEPESERPKQPSPDQLADMGIAMIIVPPEGQADD